MADISRTVNILFKGTDDVSGILNDIANNFDNIDAGGLNSDFSDTTQTLLNVNEAAGNIAGSILSAAAAAVTINASFNALAAGGIALAVTKAGQFSDEMNTVNTLLDISSDEFKGFKNAVLEYSESSVLSLEDIELSLYNLISLGVDYKDSLSAMQVIEQLAVGTRSTLNQATETLIGTMNAYGAEMDEAQDYSDAFFTIIKDGKTTLPELSSSIADVTGIAAAAGIPFETLGAAIAAMTASGAPTAQAITKIKATIEGIINPTNQAAAAAEALGIDFSAAAIESKGFEVVLKEVYDATGGSVEEMAKLFTSTEALQGALILGADKAGTFAGALEDMANNAGVSEDAFDKMAKNLDLIWQNMLNNFGSVVIKLGSNWEDSSKELIAAVTATFQGLGASVDEGTFDSLITVIDDVIKEITDNINVMAENLPEALAGVDFTEYIESFKAIGEALGSSFEGLDLTSAEGMEAVFQSIIDVMGTLNEVTASAIEALKFVFDVVEQLIKPSEDASGAVKAVADGLETVGTVAELVGKNLGYVVAAFITFKTIGIVATIVQLGASFSVLYENVRKFKTLAGLFSDKTSVFSPTVWETLKTPLSDVNSKFLTLKTTIGLLAGAGASFGAGWVVGTILRENIPQIDEVAQKLIGAADEAYRFLGLPGADFIFGPSFDNAGESVDAASKEVQKILDQIGKLPTSVSTVEIFAAVEAGDLEKAQELINEIVNSPDYKNIDIIATITKEEWDVFESEWNELVENPDVSVAVSAAINEGDFEKVQALLDGDLEATVEVKVDEASKEKATQEIQYWTESGGWQTIEVPVDATGVDEAKSKIEDIPTEKQLEIRLQGDIDKELALISTNAEILQSAFEWDAKLNIAEIEAQAAIVESTFGSINTSIESTADLIGTALGTLNDPGSFEAKWAAQDILREETALREKSFRLQKEMTESQVKYMDAKTKALESGGAEISINSSGLEPALEMVMWEIIKKVQVRANENASDFLLGL